MGVKCWKCGKPATKTRANREYDFLYRQVVFTGTSTKPSKWSRCYCDECYEAVTKQEQEENALYVKLKKREMFRRACTLLEKQITDMYAYKDAIDIVESVLEEKPDKFDSSYEVLAAIILVHEGVLSKMQYRVGKYQVDFVLPEMHTVLEIDGERHKYSGLRDKERDKEIKKALGSGWEIIRIKTDYLDQNAKKLVDAIDAVLESRETKRYYSNQKTVS